MTKPRVPTGLNRSGRKLWDGVVEHFEMSPHELVQLEEACRVRDQVFALRDAVARDGLMIGSSQGDRLHPAVVEVRQQQLALARLLATLGVPGLEEDNLPASRGVRGVYTGTNYRRAR